MRRQHLAAVLAASLVLPACDREAVAQNARAAERISHAVQTLRQAEGDAKRPRLLELRSLACQADDVCELRDTCVDAYTLYLAGHDKTQAVRRSLAREGGGDGGNPRTAAALLAQAERDVQKGKRLATRCTDLEAQVRRRYGLR